MIRRFIYILRAALVAGLASFARVLVGLVNTEIRYLSSGVELLPSGHPYRNLVDLYREPEPFLSDVKHTVEQLPKKSVPKLEILNGNPDREDTAIFRLPTELMERDVTLRFNEDQLGLLRRVCQQENTLKDEVAIMRALSLFADVSSKMKQGYTLRLERTGRGPKISFIYE